MRSNILKKFFIGFNILGILLFCTFIVNFRHHPISSHCPFCDHSVLNSQQFYEEDLVVALYTHKPVLPGHSLIIPKRHVERFEELTGNEILQIGQVVQKVNQAAEKVFGTSSYLLLQKNGKEVGQSVPHIHFHYIPRKKDDDSIIKFMINMYIGDFKKPLHSDEMEEIVEKMKAAMER